PPFGDLQERVLIRHHDYDQCFFFASRRRHTRSYGDWSSDVCSSDLPALDDPPRGRRAPGSERTGEAGAQVAIAVEIFRMIHTAMDFGEFCARRASVVVVLGVVDEVLPGEE